MNVTYQISKSEIDFEINWDQNLSQEDNIKNIITSIADKLSEDVYHDRFNIDTRYPPTEEHQDAFLEIWKKAIKEEKENPLGFGETSRDSIKNNIYYSFVEMLEEDGRSFMDSIYQENGYVDLEKLSEQIIDEISERHQIEVEIYPDDLANAIEEKIGDNLEEKDYSGPTDLISYIGNITLVYYPALSEGRLNWDDKMVQCDSNTGSFIHVIPDENFENMIHFTGHRAKECFERVASELGIDIDESNEYRDIFKDFYKDKLWEVLEDVGMHPEHIELWKDLIKKEKHHRHESNKPIFSLDRLVEVIDNTNGYGLAAQVFKINARDLMNLKDDDTLLIKGGQVGIHDPINGSGHMEDGINPSKIKVSELVNGLTTNTPKGCLGSYSIDSIFGYCGNAYEADCRAVTVDNISVDRKIEEDKIAIGMAKNEPF